MNICHISMPSPWHHLVLGRTVCCPESLKVPRHFGPVLGTLEGVPGHFKPVLGLPLANVYTLASFKAPISVLLARGHDRIVRATAWQGLRH
jgi:hypothetical protein